MISIHALREEGDLFITVPIKHQKGISIHALREEGDDNLHKLTSNISNFYPRPPRGGRHFCYGIVYNKGVISIHALREEGDLERPWKLLIRQKHFYPRPPRGGRLSGL